VTRANERNFVLNKFWKQLRHWPDSSLQLEYQITLLQLNANAGQTHVLAWKTWIASWQAAAGFRKAFIKRVRSFRTMKKRVSLAMHLINHRFLPDRQCLHTHAAAKWSIEYHQNKMNRGQGTVCGVGCGLDCRTRRLVSPSLSVRRMVWGISSRQRYCIDCHSERMRIIRSAVFLF
jgi:hypothetical protein